MKLFWIIAIGGAIWMCILIKRFFSWMDQDISPLPVEPLRSITITQKLSGFWLEKADINDVVKKINERLRKPFGQLSDQIDVDNVVSITTIPITSKGVVQFTVWYKDDNAVKKMKTKPKKDPYKIFGGGGYKYRDYNNRSFWS